MHKKKLSIAFILAIGGYASLIHAENQSAPTTPAPATAASATTTPAPATVPSVMPSTTEPVAEKPANAAAPQNQPAENSPAAAPATQIAPQENAVSSATANGEQDSLSLLRASMRIDKRDFLKTAMGLSDKEGEKFWTLYYQYEAELMKLNDRKLQLIKDYAADFNTLTEEKAGKLAKSAFDIQKSRTSLLESYYKKIGKAVSYRIAARFAQIENVFNAAMDVKIGASIPLMPKQ